MKYQVQNMIYLIWFIDRSLIRIQTVRLRVIRNKSDKRIKDIFKSIDRKCPWVWSNNESNEKIKKTQNIFYNEIKKFEKSVHEQKKQCQTMFYQTSCQVYKLKKIY